MGSCHSTNFLVIDKNNFRNCIICWETVSLETIYIKCVKCNILLHDYCASQYKININCKNIDCPQCKNVNSLFRYDNVIYDCKKL